MWKYTAQSNYDWNQHDDWHQLDNPDINTRASLDKYIVSGGNVSLTPVGPVSGHYGCFMSAEGTYKFRYMGHLHDEPPEPITMTPYFTLEEIEAAQNMIKGE